MTYYSARVLDVCRVCFVVGVALFCLAPSMAEAKKCPPGQYGVLKCIKCPANTYAYKAHIITKLGCKKCPKGTYSSAGSRSCKDKSCKAKINGKTQTIASGRSVCNHKTGKRQKCYRGVFATNGNCRVCQARDHQGYRRNFAHGKKRCSRDFWYTCVDGSWVKGKSCKVTKGCGAQAGLGGAMHGESKCNEKDRFMYKCNNGKWIKGKACNKRGCKLNGTMRKHGQIVCKPGRVKGEESLIQCDDGRWETIARTCKKKK